MVVCLGTSICHAIHTVQNPLICLDIAIVPKDLVMDLDPQGARCCATKQEDLCLSFVVHLVHNALR